VMAARAYFTLDYLGLGNNAALLDGGIEKWRSEHRPTTKERPNVQPGKLHIHVQQDALVDTAFMNAVARSSSAFVLLDARPKPEYTGLRLSEGITESGHIPGARSLYWQDLLVPGDVPQLLPISELKDKFVSAGADPGVAVITYCRTGMQSSFDYFVAKYLGYRVQMYVGSFYEWTKSSHGGQTSAFCH
ncbi:MAG: hypothetical protein JO065_10185, partial [Acidobacteria bacterium]|nr:hypothetical protein [Acidobacteriota bacterium]